MQQCFNSVDCEVIHLMCNTKVLAVQPIVEYIQKILILARTFLTKQQLDNVKAA